MSWQYHNVSKLLQPPDESACIEFCFFISSSNTILNQGVKAAATDFPGGFDRTLQKSTWFCLYCITHECLHLVNVGNVLSEGEELRSLERRWCGLELLFFYFIYQMAWQIKCLIMMKQQLFQMCPFGKKTVYFYQGASLSPTRGPTGFQAVIKEMTSWVSCCWALFVLKAFICLLSQGILPCKLFHLDVFFIHRNVSCGKEAQEHLHCLLPLLQNCSCPSPCFPFLMALFSLQTPSQFSILQLLINDFLTLLLIANVHANTSVPYKLLSLITGKIPE